ATAAGCLLFDPFPDVAQDRLDPCPDASCKPPPCGGHCVAGPNASGATCTNEQCIQTCKTGFADCNQKANDGCEIDITKEFGSCGGCGLSCEKPNSNGTCVDGHCKLTCHDSFVDCDGRLENGCEVDISS